MRLFRIISPNYSPNKKPDVLSTFLLHGMLQELAGTQQTDNRTVKMVKRAGKMVYNV